jgi:hypothetical protein
MVLCSPLAGELCWCLVAEGHVGSVVVVFEAPVIDEDFGFEEGVERFHLEKLAAQVAVKGLDVGVLPRCAGFDVGGGDAGEAAPVPQALSDEFGAVVAPDVIRSASPLEEFFEDRDDSVRVDRPSRHGREAFAGELVRDIEDLDRSALAGFIEAEVHGPDVIGVIGHDITGSSAALLATAGPLGHVKPFVSPAPLDTLAIAMPTLSG